MDKVRGSIGPTVAAYNPRGRSAGSLISCVTIWLIMIFRTIHVAVYIIRSAINARTTSLIVGCIFGVIGTLFVAWCLAKIAIAEGKRRVLGINWVRTAAQHLHSSELIRSRAAGTLTASSSSSLSSL